MINGDLNFSISTEGLSDKGRDIAKNNNEIKEARNELNEARRSLEGWISANKDRYDNKVAAGLPKIDEMIEVIVSYSGVAVQTSQRAEAVENKIASAIDNEFFG